MPNKLSKEDFIFKANQIHKGRFDYSAVKYQDNKTKVCIICKDHGEFYQQPSKHLLGQGCPKCSDQRLTLDEFISKANQTHNFCYDYSEVVYVNWKTKVCVVCSEHGKFWQRPDAHLSGQGCPKCKASKGEKKIERWLTNEGVAFIPQKRFESCRGKVKPLPFDFFLPQDNICIEYNGKQHYQKESRFYSEELIHNDKTKAKYCLDNNIWLIVIPYWEDVVTRLRTLVYRKVWLEKDLS